MSCLRQSVSFHRIALETGLQGLFLALPISAAATRAEFSPQIHTEIPETPVAATAPSQPCLPHVPASLPSTHGTMEPLTLTLHGMLLQTEPRLLLAAQGRSYTSPAATLPNHTPKPRSGATHASLLMHCRGRARGCRTLPPEAPGVGSPPEAPGGEVFTHLGKAAEPNLYILKWDAEIRPYTGKKGLYKQAQKMYLFS